MIVPLTIKPMTVPAISGAGGNKRTDPNLARRLGKKEAAMAVGHSILVIAWHLLTNDCDYADLGGDFFVRRDLDRARQRGLPSSRPSATWSPSNPSPHDGNSPFRMGSTVKRTLATVQKPSFLRESPLPRHQPLRICPEPVFEINVALPPLS
jgi:hypothetical protein